MWTRKTDRGLRWKQGSRSIQDIWVKAPEKHPASNEAERDEKMERNKVWIYCRVAHEDSEALRWQREQLEAYAYGHKMDIAGITAKYEGGTTLERPGIGELNQVAEGGMADILLVKEPGRLVRNSLLAAGYLEWLKRKGISVICMDGSLPEAGLEKLLAKEIA